MSGQFLDSTMTLTTGSVVRNQKKDVVSAVAGAAITVGVPVRLSYSTLGRSVIAANSTDSGQIFGFYEGVGGTGAATSTTGLTGFAAVTGDAVEIVTRGYVAARGRMTATNANTLSTTNVGVALGCATVDYTFNIVTAPVAAGTPRFMLATAGTVTDGTTAEIIGMYINNS